MSTQYEYEAPGFWDDRGYASPGDRLRRREQAEHRKHDTPSLRW